MRDLVRDRDRLSHILEAIDRILEYTNDKSKEQLKVESLTFYGIVKNIEIIGEASYKLTKAFRSKHPETPWEVISKMRHVLVHDYYQIDIDQIWKVVQTELILLKRQIKSYIEETNWEEWEKNEIVISESAVRKSLLESAIRMKKDGLSPQQISRYTGLSVPEIDELEG